MTLAPLTGARSEESWFMSSSSWLKCFSSSSRTMGLLARQGAPSGPAESADRRPGRDTPTEINTS